jgi:hypothetical protein
MAGITAQDLERASDRKRRKRRRAAALSELLNEEQQYLAVGKYFPSNV